eukprot:5991250-Pyramimonas_sp.AAC.1
MGESFAVRSFVHCFSAAVEAWQRGQTQWDPQRDFLRVRCPRSQDWQDLSLAKYADDLTKQLVGS